MTATLEAMASPGRTTMAARRYISGPAPAAKATTGAHRTLGISTAAICSHMTRPDHTAASSHMAAAHAGQNPGCGSQRSCSGSDRTSSYVSCHRDDPEDFMLGGCPGRRS